MNNLCVLQIEDDYDFAALTNRWLSSETTGTEFTLTWTTSREAAGDRLAQGDVDVILLDLDLPDSRGLATIAAIRGISPNVPIVVLSGEESEGVAMEATKLGAEDYLVKSSCNPEVLSRSIARAVIRHRLGAGARAASRAETDEPHEGERWNKEMITVGRVLGAEFLKSDDQACLLLDLSIPGPGTTLPWTSHVGLATPSGVNLLLEIQAVWTHPAPSRADEQLQTTQMPKGPSRYVRPGPSVIY